MQPGCERACYIVCIVFVYDILTIYTVSVCKDVATTKIETGAQLKGRKERGVFASVLLVVVGHQALFVSFYSVVGGWPKVPRYAQASLAGGAGRKGQEKGGGRWGGVLLSNALS